jgi:hypothetical protein
MLQKLEQMQERWRELYQSLQQQASIILPRSTISLPSLLNKKQNNQETTQEQLASIKASLIVELNLRLNDFNDPIFQYIQVSKLFDFFVSSTTASSKTILPTPDEKKFLKSRISNIRTKIGTKIGTKITKLKPTNIKKVISPDFISGSLGYISMILGGITTFLQPDYYDSRTKNSMSDFDFQSRARIERSMEEFQDSSSPQLASKSSSRPLKGIKFLGGDYFGKPYAITIQEKASEPLDSPESQQVEIETFLYSDEIPSASSSSHNPIISEGESDLGSGNSSLNINR